MVVLGLDVGEDAETVAKYVSAKYSVAGYPTTFVIDRQGKIAFREIGGSGVEEVRSAVQSALRTSEQ